MFNDTILYNSSRVSITTDIQSITVSSTLTIANVNKSVDEGFYRCRGYQSGVYIDSIAYFLKIEGKHKHALLLLICHLLCMFTQFIWSVTLM